MASTTQLKLIQPEPREEQRPTFAPATLAGRLVEISAQGGAAPLTQALGLVLAVQCQNEPVAWLTAQDNAFFPPDAAAGGVDLNALAVIRLPGMADMGRAADKLLRSGAFALVVLDMTSLPETAAPQSLATPLTARLSGLARKHHSTLLLLTNSARDASFLGSFTSLRAQSLRRRESGAFACELQVKKDRRFGPGWSALEMCDGCAGLV